MKYDCVIIGGGPAGLNAALVLGRARRTVALIDHGRPRNAVTHASHGFITRDGIQPAEFRRIALEEVLQYPTVHHIQEEVVDIQSSEQGFDLHTAVGGHIQAHKMIMAAGLREELPDIEGAQEFYGKSLFNCPFCDGWELRDQPLVIVSNTGDAFHRAKLLLNWSQDLIVCTSGGPALTPEQIQVLTFKGVRTIDTPVAAFSGRNGMLERVHFTDGSSVERSGGFLSPALIPNHAHFANALGYQTADNGAVVTDPMGRTTVQGIYAAGDSAYVMPSQLIYAAASGSKAAMGVVADLTEEQWKDHV
ncbi:NAD(P)/FAD-dependent oxidoreductase [Paenibacillus massiliensis]|uniref:NAD(P)/FAD-dependent oxidoreductase n=1 Tax=Paenibacillus massiliensis TaxID=225917 RepID=UPI0004715CE3|nr:NAD(P)/FAD-dependent oxidoreductase [Paenibacillus massiliensis]